MHCTQWEEKRETAVGQMERTPERSEAEFLDVFRTKVLRVFLLAIHSNLYQRILLLPPLEQRWYESVL